MDLRKFVDDQVKASDPLREGLSWSEIDSFTMTRGELDALLEMGWALDEALAVYDYDHKDEADPSWVKRARSALKAGESTTEVSG